jgi:hypothetical protein
VPPWQERADCSNLAERITIEKLNFRQLNKPKILKESDLASVVLVGMMTQGDPPFCSETMLGNLVKKMQELAAYRRDVMITLDLCPQSLNSMKIIFKRGRLLRLECILCQTVANSEQADEVYAKNGLLAAFEDCRDLSKEVNDTMKKNAAQKMREINKRLVEYTEDTGSEKV